MYSQRPKIALLGVLPVPLGDWSKSHHLLDFIYIGEIKIFQDDLESFLKVAKRFKLEGLLNEDVDHTINSSPNEKFTQSLVKEEDIPSPVIQEKTKTHNAEQEQERSLFSSDNDIIKEEVDEVPVLNEENIKISVADEEKNDLNETINLYLKRREDGYWSCTLCDNYLNKKKQRAMNHIEAAHLEGVSLPCPLCDRILKSRKALESHKYRIHKETQDSDSLAAWRASRSKSILIEKLGSDAYHRNKDIFI